MNNRTKIFCNKCRQYTLHELEYSHILYSDDIDYLALDNEYFEETLYTTTIKLWTCCGCEQATMQEIIEDPAFVIDSEFYPIREKNHLPRKNYLQLNSKLSQIYEEIIVCYNNATTILCAAGLRALLEGVCADKGIEGRALFHKIDNLKPLLPGNIVDNLHIFRFMGNEAVHELSAPSIDELRSTIEVMEDLLNYLYHLDYKAASLARKTGIDSTGQKIQPSMELIKRVLERSPKLALGQAVLFEALYKASEKGLSYKDIAMQIERTTEQLAGVLGALGRRINNTVGIDGKPGINYLFEYVPEVNGEPGTWGWRMRYEFEQVIKNGNYSWAKDWK